MRGKVGNKVETQKQNTDNNRKGIVKEEEE